MLSASDTWYFMQSFSSWPLERPEPGVGSEGSGETSLGGVGGKVNRWGLE